MTPAENPKAAPAVAPVMTPPGRPRSRGARAGVAMVALLLGACDGATENAAATPVAGADIPVPAIASGSGPTTTAAPPAPSMTPGDMTGDMTPEDLAPEDMAQAMAGDLSFGEVNLAAIRELMETPPEEDGPFYMVNYIKYRERAVYADGRETNLTGQQADAMYAPIEFLQQIGATIVFTANVETQLPLGDGTRWDTLAIVNYPSRAKFLEMLADPAFQARSVHKDAGLEKSIVLVTEPIDLPVPTPGLPPFPATLTDTPFEMVHLLHYREVASYPADAGEPERSGREAMALYQDNAGTVAAPLGVYPRAWFQVKAVLIGDGRDWDEVRINHFPSHATFDALTADATWQSGTYHRDAALADTYALQSLPLLNTL